MFLVVFGFILTQQPCEPMVQETEPNNGYAQAQNLVPGPSGWDISLRAEIAQSDAGVVVNDYGSGADDLEDLFRIDLSEATPLVIAVIPEVQATDLDMFILSDTLPNQNFFVDNPSLDPNIDFSAGALGFENVAKVFPPGTYYICVSLFEGDTVPATAYTLRVTESPILFETFDDSASLDAFEFAVLPDDSDGLPNWSHSNEMVGVTEYGAGLAQRTETLAGIEANYFISPPFTVPICGFTMVDFDVASFYQSAAADEISQWNILVYILDPDLTTLNGWSWNESATATPLEFDFKHPFWVGYTGYVNAMMGLGSTFDYLLNPYAGQPLRIAVSVQLIEEMQPVAGDVITLIDNLRILHVPAPDPCQQDYRIETWPSIPTVLELIGCHFQSK